MKGINTTQEALAVGIEYRAYMPLVDRIAARDAAGTPSNAAKNGIKAKDGNGNPVTLTFASLAVYLVFMVAFVTGL